MKSDDVWQPGTCWVAKYFFVNGLLLKAEDLVLVPLPLIKAVFTTLFLPDPPSFETPKDFLTINYLVYETDFYFFFL